MKVSEMSLELNVGAELLFILRNGWGIPKTYLRGLTQRATAGLAAKPYPAMAKAKWVQPQRNKDTSTAAPSVTRKEAVDLSERAASEQAAATMDYMATARDKHGRPW